MSRKGSPVWIRSWSSARRLVVADVVLALLLVGSSAVLLKVLSPRAATEDWLFVVLLGLPLALRRSVPRTSAILVGAAALLQVLVGSPIGFHDAAVLVALASLTGWASRRDGLLGLGLASLLIGVAALTPWWSYLDEHLGPRPHLVHLWSTAGALVLLLAAWAYGAQVRHAHQGADALRDRADLLEREREQQFALAAAAERTRIAREMHDVVAHGLSVMVVQAEGARFALPESATVSREALAQVAQTGRTALGEMRQLLGLLRTEAPAASPPMTKADSTIERTQTQLPAPGLADLYALVDQARSAGATVSLRQHGNLEAAPPVVALTAYRAVQEALTNARRHGGDEIEVDVTATAAELIVRVHDDGRRLKERQGPGAEAPATGSGGLGLVGLRERVDAVGGHVDIGPATRGGYTVRVTLPLPHKARR